MVQLPIFLCSKTASSTPSSLYCNLGSFFWAATSPSKLRQIFASGKVIGKNSR